MRGTRREGFSAGGGGGGARRAGSEGTKTRAHQVKRGASAGVAEPAHVPAGLLLEQARGGANLVGVVLLHGVNQRLHLGHGAHHLLRLGLIRQGLGSHRGRVDAWSEGNAGGSGRARRGRTDVSLVARARLSPRDARGGRGGPPPLTGHRPESSSLVEQPWQSPIAHSQGILRKQI